jgi:hypothetical protein
MSVMSRTSQVYYRGVDELRGMAESALAGLGVMPLATVRIALLEPQLAHPGGAGMPWQPSMSAPSTATAN